MGEPSKRTPDDPVRHAVAVPRDLVEAIVYDLRQGLSLEPETVDALAALLETPGQPDESCTPIARPLAEWNDDDGDVLWWRLPVTEPPYAGSPLDSDWPGYHTHWTPIVGPGDA